MVRGEPLGNCDAPPLPNLAHKLSVGSVRVDLSGCGGSSGEPVASSYARDAEDIRFVIEHLRHEQSVRLLKERARGATPSGPPPQAVLGIVGVGTGGTAALRYAALYPSDPVPFIATISARASHACPLRSLLNWGEIDTLKKDGDVVVEPSPMRPGLSKALRITQEDFDAVPDLAGAANPAIHYLLIHGSKDEGLPPAEATALDDLIGQGPAASHELRVVPGVGGDWAGHESTLAYAIGDWIWRRTQQGDGASQAQSGFNVFVDDLGAKVREIHAGTRMQLPSIDNGMDDDDDDDDDDDA